MKLGISIDTVGYIINKTKLFYNAKKNEKIYIGVQILNQGSTGSEGSNCTLNATISSVSVLQISAEQTES